jgi:hypothetical protein
MVLFGLWCLMPLLTLFHLVVSFIGGGKKQKISLMKKKGINVTALIQNILHGNTL